MICIVLHSLEGKHISSAWRNQHLNYNLFRLQSNLAAFFNIKVEWIEF